MKFALKFGLLPLALGSTVSSRGRKGQGIDKNDFVYVKGLRLYDGKGLHYITGIAQL
jgi:mannan endo-1,4-beta-mannosidase